MLSEFQRYLLQEMDIPVWVEKTTQQARSLPIASSEEVTLKAWDTVAADAAMCQKCALSQHRRQVVFGAGNRKASLVLIGEAPGETEDKEGLPFVGRAGMLLNSILAAVGLSRDTLYICNIVKCRPPYNRAPTPEERAACFPYLEAQLALIKPRWIVALGLTAAQTLLGVDTPLKSLRKQHFAWHSEKIPLRVTYHPAYLLRQPKDKAKAYEDWLAIRAMIEGDVPPSDEQVVL